MRFKCLGSIFLAWAMHLCAFCIFTKSGALSNQANDRCIAHAGYFDKLQDNKHLRENPTNLREKPYCLLPQLTVSIFLNLLIPKNNPDFFENNQATACTEYLANTPPMPRRRNKGQSNRHWQVRNLTKAKRPNSRRVRDQDSAM